MSDAAAQLDTPTQRHERAAPPPQTGEIRQWFRRPTGQLHLQGAADQRQQRAPVLRPELSALDGKALRGES